MAQPLESLLNQGASASRGLCSFFDFFVPLRAVSIVSLGRVPCLFSDCEASPSRIDIAIATLSKGEFTPLARILSGYDDMGRPEVVVVEHLLDRIGQALNRLGVRRIVEAHDLKASVALPR